MRRGLIILVEGAGGFEAAARNIFQAAAEAEPPLDAIRYRWTHGFGRIAADQMRQVYLKKAARILADLLIQWRQEAPDRPLFLIGHSAGCGLALVAADHLPPNTLERIVLLAPAVSSHYDLRLALRSSCQGIDVFNSYHDWATLGLGTLIFGTTDRYRLGGAAGKDGFKPNICCVEDVALYSKLRHHPWDPTQICIGHDGGHYGSYQPEFLRARVMPLLQTLPPAQRGDETSSLSEVRVPKKFVRRVGVSTPRCSLPGR